MIDFDRSTGSPRSGALRLSLVILGAWAVCMLLLAICQLLGAPLGLAVHPTGEDRVWIDILSRPGAQSFQGWWALASRNPLAPWCYKAFWPLIHAFPEGLYLSRKLLDLFQAVTAALFVNEVCRGRRPVLALGCGVLILVWNFSGYVENILFIMLVAMGFSMLSLYFYARYLNHQRSVAEHLALSLVTFLIAVATYSIQCGVPLAVGALGLAHHLEARSQGASSRWPVRVIGEVLLYGAIFVIFTMIWITTSGPTSGFFKVDLGLFFKQLLVSIKNFAWHDDTTDLVRSLQAHWSIGWQLAIFAIGGIASYWLLSWYSRARTGDEATEGGVAGRCLRHPVALVLVAAFCLVLPTIVLESSSTIWYPGSRSRMVQQIFQPVAYLSIVSLLAIGARRWRFTQLRIAGTAILCACGLLLSVEYNRKLVELSAYESGLVSGLKKLVPTMFHPVHFVVRIDNEDWYGGRNAELNRLLVRQGYGCDGATLDALFRNQGDATRVMVLGPDDQGVFCPGIQSYVPYAQTLFLAYDGHSLTRLTRIDVTTFAGYQVNWMRQSAYVEAEGSAKATINSTDERFDFDVTPPGLGWSVPERSPEGDTFVWMSSKSASIAFSQLAPGSYRIDFRVLQPISPEIRDSLKLSVNGVPAAISVVSSHDGKYEYSTGEPLVKVQSGGRMDLVFTVSGTIAPAGGARDLALPFDWIAVHAVTPAGQ